MRGFAVTTWIEEWGTYAMKQLAQLKDGTLKIFVDKGDNSPTGPFVGLDKVVDAVDVRGFSSCLFILRNV